MVYLKTISEIFVEINFERINYTNIHILVLRYKFSLIEDIVNTTI